MLQELLLHFTHRDYLSTNSHRLMPCVTEEVSVYRDGFAVELIRPACEVSNNNNTLVTEF